MTLGGCLRTPTLFVGGLMALGLALAGCAGFGTAGPGCGGGGGEAGASPSCTQMPTLPSGAISRDAAVAAAIRVAPRTPNGPFVVFANLTENPFRAGAAAERQLVWLVRLEGSLTASPCPSGFLDRFAQPSDPICLDTSGGVDAVLDITTGALLGWTH